MPAHVYEPGMSYLLTMVTCDRARLFADPRYAEIAHQDIAFYARKFAAVSLGHVVMPAHVHWALLPSEGDYRRFAREQQEQRGKYAADPQRYYLSKIVEDYRRHTASAVNQMRGARGIPVWQSGFRDDGLRTPVAVREAVRYAVENRLVAGLVRITEDYPWLAWNAGWLV